MRIANRSGRRVAAAAAVFGVAAALAAGGTVLATAHASTSGANAQAMGVRVAGGHPAYGFRTLDDHADLTFNQLPGINDDGLIAGYFGSGAQGHPNMGYLFGSGGYRAENFPGSVQTQVTGLNNQGVTVGFWSSMNTARMTNNNFGFVDVDGHFRNADFPTSDPASPPVDQLLGVNDNDIAVGFYTDGQGNNHGYEYNINTGRYSTVTENGAPGASLTAAAINDRGDVAGFVTNGGVTDGFIKFGNQTFISLAVPGASATTALGVNNYDEVVGTYTVGSGSSAVMHGFTWTPQHGFRTVDDPHGVGTTTINGVNDFGQVVGFYVDANGNTDGFLATP